MKRIYYVEGYGINKQKGFIISKKALYEICKSMRTDRAIAINKRSTIAEMLNATNEGCYRITRKQYYEKYSV